MDPQAPQQKKSAAELLHKDSQLQRLRTYQGDVAEAIKRQNESVATIAVKEQEKKGESFAKPKREIGVNFFVLILSVLLIAGSASALLYLFGVFTKEQTPAINIETDIIPYNTSVVLSNITSENLASELGKVSLSGGVALVKVSGINGENVISIQDFLKLLGAEAPAALSRNLNGDFMLGLYVLANGEKHAFIIMKTDGFGTTFAGMLEWEESLSGDLAFLDARAISTSTPAATFVWKDLIVKNKDTRAFVNQGNDDDVVLAYTFLDKSAILVTNSLETLSEISNAYASREVAR